MPIYCVKKNRVIVKMQLTGIHVVSKPRRRVSPHSRTKVFDYVPMRYTIDPKLVMVQFRRIQDETQHNVGMMTIPKAGLKQLDLVVGDVVNVEISK